MELKKKMDTCEMAIQDVEEKIKQIEVKATIEQVKIIIGVLKASLRVYELGFEKCRVMAQRLFLRINANLPEARLLV